MIKPLRKRHLQVWSALLVLIPLGIVSALLVRPKPVKTVLLQPLSAEALPVILKTIDRENYTVSLRGNDQTATQLEWINKSVLTFPTAVIYKASTPKESFRTNPFHGGASESFNPEKAELIGRIEARGTYRFALKPDPTNNYYLVLYDFIHQQKIDSIEFK